MTTITEYSATEAALAGLRTKYESAVFEVTTTKGMTVAKEARAEVRKYRIDLEKERVRIKAPALEHCRQIDSEAKRITAELEALEKPIDEQIKAEEQRKEREKAAKEQAEREARDAMNRRFDEIRALPLKAVGKTEAEIDEIIAEAQKTDTDSFPDNVKAAAVYELKIAIASLKAAKDARYAQEREAAKIAAEREELERLRAEQAAVQAERERIAAEEAERVAAEARRVEELEREKREAIERAEREAREAEQARIDAERAEQRRKEDAERAKAAEKLRKEQEAAAEARAKFEAEKKAAAKREREQAIANASLISAATEALGLLKAEGFADHIITQKLDAAISREPQRKAA